MADGLCAADVLARRPARPRADMRRATVHAPRDPEPLYRQPRTALSGPSCTKTATGPLDRGRSGAAEHDAETGTA